MSIQRKEKAFVIALVSVIVAIVVFLQLQRLRTQEGTRQPEIPAELKRIASSNPGDDLRASLAKRDFRLIGIMSVGLETPGVASFEEQLRYMKLLGVRIIEGTTDAPLSDEHSHLQKKARQYAMSYNTMLLAYLKQNPGALPNEIKDSL